MVEYSFWSKKSKIKKNKKSNLFFEIDLESCEKIFETKI